MKNRKREGRVLQKFSLVAIFISSMSFTSAGIAGYIDNMGSVTDTETGYRWLDLSATFGISLHQATIDNPNYSHASIAQVRAFFDSAGVRPDGLHIGPRTKNEIDFILTCQERILVKGETIFHGQCLHNSLSHQTS